MEVCVDSLQSVIAAYEGGANRIELCSSLNEGGLTPSVGLLKSIRNYFKSKELVSLPINCMIRSRVGDFLYSDTELETMLEDLKQFVEMEVDGIVFGALTVDGLIDTNINKEFLSYVPYNIKKTFHRAFDVCSDWRSSFEQISNLGFDSLLTSGQKRTAYEGRELIRTLVENRSQLANKVNIIAGAGVNASNLSSILIETNCDEFHASCRSTFKSQMVFRNTKISMGSPLIDEFETKSTDKLLVKQLVDIFKLRKERVL